MSVLYRLLLSSLCCPLALHAATEVPIDSHITEVTVYQNRAMIERSARTSLKTGEQWLLVDHLPPGLLPNSLQVDGKGQARVLISAVEIQRRFSSELIQANENKLQQQINKLQLEQSGIDNKLSALDARLKFIDSLSSSPKGRKDGKALEINPAQWQQAWKVIGQGVEETLDKKTALQQQRKIISDKLSAIQRELRSMISGRTDELQAIIKTTVNKPGAFTLKLSYQINGADWSPIYDIRLNVEQQQTQLTQRAQVRQNTGEDWRNVKLKLSTSQPAQSTSMPDVYPWFLNFHKPVARRSYAPARARSAPAMTAPAEEALMDMEEESQFAAQQVIASVNDNAFSAEFEVPGKLDIPSGNTPSTFTLQQFTLDTQLAVQAQPRIDRKAYLFSKVQYKGDAPLLAGTANIFRDNAFIASNPFKTVQPGERFDIPFGVDDKVKLDYRKISEERDDSKLLSSNKSLRRHLLITSENHHRQPIKINLYERIPVAQNKDIEVEILKKTDAPSSKDVDNKQGVWLWSADYKAGEKRNINIHYQINYPKDKTISGLD